MIHHELGVVYVPGEGGPSAVDLVNPRDHLIAREEGMDANELATIRVEAVRALHAWVFEAGPGPRPVAERLVLATQEYAPGFLQELSTEDVAALTHGSHSDRRRAVLRTLLGQRRPSRAQIDRHDADVNGILGKAFRREGHTLQLVRGEASGLERLRCREEDETAPWSQAMRAWLRPVWKSGGLGEALKAFYALTRGLWPELMLNMTGDEVAGFFAQTRQAESVRERQLLNRRLEAHGHRPVALRFQKSVEACRSYAKAATGNTHRADSVGRAAA